MDDRRNVGEISCNFGGGRDQKFESFIFMMMMMMMMILLVELVRGMKNSQYTKRFAFYEHNNLIKIDINKYNKTRRFKNISPITPPKTQNPLRKQRNKQTKRDRTTCRAGSTIKFVVSTHFIDKKFHLFNYLSLIYAYLMLKKLHEDDLRTIETCRSSDGLYVKLCIICKIKRI